MTDRHLNLCAGLLIALGLVAGLASIAPAIDASDYLHRAPEAALQVRLAAVAQLIMALTYLGVAALFYPRLKGLGPELAVLFLGARLLSVALVVTSAVVMLLLLGLAQQGGSLSPSGIAVISALGDSLKLTRDHLNHVFMIVVFGVGNVAFYLLARRATLLPRWLKIVGLLGVICASLASGLVFFGKLEIITPAYLAMNLPAVVSEVCLAGWLIAHGLLRPSRSLPTT